MSLNSILNVIQGDMNEIRNAHYAGDNQRSWMADLPFIVRLPFILLNLVIGCPWTLIFIAFFALAIQKMHVKYGIMLIIASMSQLIGSILIAGRAGFVYWILSIAACYIYFRPFFSKKQKKIVNYLLYILLFLLFLYLYYLTSSRFSEVEMGAVSGSQGGIISYLGKPFVNFCYFFDTFECPRPSLEIIFPLSYKLMGSSFEGAVDIQRYLSLISGRELGTFYTFIGQIQTTSSNFVAIVFCFFYSFITNISISRRKFLSNIKNAYWYLATSSVLFLGLFGHYYSTYSLTVSVFTFYFFIIRNGALKFEYKKQ